MEELVKWRMKEVVELSCIWWRFTKFNHLGEDFDRFEILTTLDAFRCGRFNVHTQFEHRSKFRQMAPGMLQSVAEKDARTEKLLRTLKDGKPEKEFLVFRKWSQIKR